MPLRLTLLTLAILSKVFVQPASISLTAAQDTLDSTASTAFLPPFS